MNSTEVSNPSKKSPYDEVLSLESWKRHFTEVPCVQSAFKAWAGCGLIMFMHKMRLYNSPFYAFRALVLVGAVSSLTELMMCGAYEQQQINKNLANKSNVK